MKYRAAGMAAALQKYQDTTLLPVMGLYYAYQHAYLGWDFVFLGKLCFKTRGRMVFSL
jgi:hypothetical protein